MPRRRDRHDRGIRGPLAAPGSPARLSRRMPRTDYFNDCLSAAIEAVLARDPLVLDQIVVGIDEVPMLNHRWSGDRVPLSAALEASGDQPAQIVLYERPIELRANSPQELRELVHRTLVEQLSTLTGRSTEDLGGPGFDD